MTPSDDDSRVSEVSPHRGGNDWASEKGNDAASQRADLFFLFVPLCHIAMHENRRDEPLAAARHYEYLWTVARLMLENKQSFEYFRKTFTFFSLWSLMNSGTKCQSDWRLSAHSEGRFVFVQNKNVLSLLVVSPRWNWIESQFYMCIEYFTCEFNFPDHETMHGMWKDETLENVNFFCTLFTLAISYFPVWTKILTCEKENATCEVHIFNRFIPHIDQNYQTWKLLAFSCAIWLFGTWEWTFPLEKCRFSHYIRIVTCSHALLTLFTFANNSMTVQAQHILYAASCRRFLQHTASALM